MAKTEVMKEEKEALCEDLKDIFIQYGAPPTGVVIFSHGRAVSPEDVSCEMSERLHMMGWKKEKYDVYALTFLDQLDFGLEDVVKDIQKIIKMIQFFELTEEKCSNILKFIKHAKERNV